MVKVKYTYLYKELFNYIKDYINHFNHFPVEFEYEGKLYDLNLEIKEVFNATE